ncbi:MAG: DEAD/DEAH box helicase, partial [Flavobacteriia bacterium]|nr:DEAD/DEAH box helicase [Flavobacteriia bacterium]
MHSPKALLNTYWGHKNFRPHQEEIIDKVLAGKDVLAILPTGAGKSLCYQLPALSLEGITLVISPLIALMHDQVA